MKLSTVIDFMPINKAFAIYEDKKLFFEGTPIEFFGVQKPKHFRSRSVLFLYADKDVLRIGISKEPTFAEGSENGT